ncbi:MAG: hypothetical protein JXA81_04970 [Sedimentisphaerales bacterium]|nr:hypothetical protein [Sedimentisphaerales bacterium]
MKTKPNKPNLFSPQIYSGGLKKQSQFFTGRISVKLLTAMVYGILSVEAGKKQACPERSRMEPISCFLQLKRAGKREKLLTASIK